jgi:hypothetical protein
MLIPCPYGSSTESRLWISILIDRDSDRDNGRVSGRISFSGSRQRRGRHDHGNRTRQTATGSVTDEAVSEEQRQGQRPDQRQLQCHFIGTSLAARFAKRLACKPN